MNINHCTSKKEFIQTLDQLIGDKSKSLKDQGITKTIITQFFKNNREYLEKNDRKLHDKFDFLANRIKQDFRDEQNRVSDEGHKILNQVIKAANQVFQIEGNNLPEDIMDSIILASLPKENPNRYLFRKLPNDLKNLREASKKIKKAADKWTCIQEIPLKRLGCKNAADAVNYAIKNHLTGGSLEDYNLTDELLDKLITNCSNLTILSIDCNQITDVSVSKLASLSRLKKLTISRYTITSLDLSQCMALETFCCSDTKNLKTLSLPKNMPFLMSLLLWGCESIEKLEFSESAEALRFINVIKCYRLKEVTLPKYTQNLKDLFFNNCQELKELTVNPSQIHNLLQVYDCQNLEKLNLPEKTPSNFKMKVRGCAKLMKENIINYEQNKDKIRFED